MGFLSSLFGSQPDWHRQVPSNIRFKDTALVSELERLRLNFGFDHDQFLLIVFASRTATLRSIRLAYDEASRLMPGRTEIEYIGLVLADRIGKKIATFAYNTSPTALPLNQLLVFADDIETVAHVCQTFEGALRFLFQIEEMEGSFNDQLGVISKVDAICSKYNSA